MWCRATAAAVVIALARCAAAGADAPVRLRVDATSANAEASPRLRVDAGTRVIVEIAKNAFHACTVATKVEALPPPANPVAQILAVLGAIPGLPTALRVDRARESAAAPSASPVLQRQIDDLARDVDALNADLGRQLDAIRERALSLPRWVACDRTPVCSDADAARARLHSLADAIQRTPSQPIASVSVAAARAAELLKTLNAAIDQPSEDDGRWLHDAFTRLRVIQELIDAAAERRQLAVKGRDALLAVRERILAYQPSTSIEEPLPPQAGARTAVTVSCANIVTQQPSIYTLGTGDEVAARKVAPVSATIVYETAPRASVSAGALFSLADRRSIGIAAHRVGVESDVVSYRRQIVEINRATTQVVPFSFVNVIVPGTRRLRAAPALSLGVGLNPNSGPTVVEYFAGGSVVIGPVAVQIGTHFGTRLEPAEEFAIGDVLPDRLTAVPTLRRRATALAVGLSYGVGIR